MKKVTDEILSQFESQDEEDEREEGAKGLGGPRKGEGCY